MKAALRSRFGPPESIVVGEVPAPVPADDEVLVRVRAASLNRADWYTAAGRPLVGRPSTGLLRPKDERLGVDFAGVVESVGPRVTRFAPGDEVFGGRTGALAEYVAVPEGRAIAHKPPKAGFAEAASIPVAGVTALQALRDKGRLRPGDRVLVNGASGGVGTLAIQVAKALGASVTAVCSTRNLDTARSLGADEVVDYTCDDFTRGDLRYDVLVDIAGSRSWSACARVLAPEARVVLVGGSMHTVLGPLGHVARMKLASLRSGREAVFFVAKLNGPDLEQLAGLLADGRLTPVVERVYPLADVADAFRHVGGGHARGKIVVTP